MCPHVCAPVAICVSCALALSPGSLFASSFFQFVFILFYF